jgi:1-acyl-sn-glycerol-3-phosphate acyltransferase
MTGAVPTRPRPLRVREVLALSLTRRRRGSGFWFGFAIALLWPFTMFGPRVAFGGGQHVPRTGGALLACNHVSDVDPIYDVAFTVSHGRMPRFLAKVELWKIPVVRSVMAGGGHIPVYRASTRAADAYKEAIEALRRGEVVVFYPEGTLSTDPDGWPMKAKNGIGRIALVTGAPVIPVANWGTQELLPADGRPRFRPRKTVQVVAGPPVDLSRWLGGPRTRTALDGATGAIMGDIAALVGGLRGEEPPAVPYDPAVAAARAAAAVETPEASAG